MPTILNLQRTQSLELHNIDTSNAGRARSSRAQHTTGQHGTAQHSTRQHVESIQRTGVNVMRRDYTCSSFAITFPYQITPGKELRGELHRWMFPVGVSTMLPSCECVASHICKLGVTETISLFGVCWGVIVVVVCPAYVVAQSED